MQRKKAVKFNHWDSQQWKLSSLNFPSFLLCNTKAGIRCITRLLQSFSNVHVQISCFGKVNFHIIVFQWAGFVLCKFSLVS